MFFDKFKKREPSNISFIFGCARGGTTWLWSLLESHPQVKPFLLQSGPNNDNIYETSESGIYLRNPKNAAKEIKEIANLFPDKLIIEKTPSHTLIFQMILKDFPKSSNIIILRHPIAIVNSIIMSTMKAFQGYDLDSSIKLVQNYYKNLIDLSNHQNTIHIVRYEDLLLDTKHSLNKLFLKLDLDILKTNEIVNENYKKSKVGVKGVFRKGESKSYLKELKHEDIIFLEQNLVKEILFFNSYS